MARGRFGRYRFVPQRGARFSLPDGCRQSESPSFLREELEGRLRTARVAFRLLLQLAEPATDDDRDRPWA